ncbi:Cof-type HAD-IIB family hydrolase [Bacteroidetes bacterium endosymbiont of Geopemphigus sp.]|uniref:Cof-type HAD-IIB family hydrolase n=1 Tax=Bacteroidetes bacterium endosymbiont of Geopemphigus sp. TaxID=2047937 RepID=UPI0011AFC72E|nr:Cof-type HAD-IIB family hydrolase [Bacteroidetes bacterium endosymbiont of Geopemphigus sp.]
MIQAVFTDIDGTLLKSNHTISHQNQKAIKKVREKGIPVFLATGRSGRDAQEYYKILDLDTPAVCMNGAYIVDLKNKHVLKEEKIPLDLVIEMKEALEPLHLSATYYSKDRWITQEITPVIKREVKVIGFSIEVMPFEDILKNWPGSHNGPNKIGLLSNNEKQLLESYELLIKKFEGRLNIQRSQLNFLEVISPEVSKKRGIEYLLKANPEQYPFLREHIMTVGDSDNDIEMLRWAGVSVAMDNAPEHVKKAAKILTLSNREDGLAHALNKYILNEV